MRGSVALYVRVQTQCMMFGLGMDEKPTESLWLRIKRKAGIGDIIAGGCYKQPDQEEQVPSIDRQEQSQIHKP